MFKQISQHQFTAAKGAKCVRLYASFYSYSKPRFSEKPQHTSYYHRSVFWINISLLILIYYCLLQAKDWEPF